MSENIEIIPKFCFHLCISLVDINTENIFQIFSNAFSSANACNINLDNINFIERDAFNNSKIKKINLLKLTNAGEGVFAECHELEYVNIKGAITEIPATMFFSCEKLKEVKLHNEIHKIGQHAFTFCKELEHINLENVKIIEDFAFTETKFKNNQLEYEEER